MEMIRTTKQHRAAQSPRRWGACQSGVALVETARVGRGDKRIIQHCGPRQFGKTFWWYGDAAVSETAASHLRPQID
jgi:hypothetical protein